MLAIEDAGEKEFALPAELLTGREVEYFRLEVHTASRESNGSPYFPDARSLGDERVPVWVSGEVCKYFPYFGGKDWELDGGLEI